MVRGDHRVNEIKLGLALGSEFRPARPEEVAEQLGPPGFIGPVGAQMPILLDAAVAAGRGGYVTGANEPDAHLRGVEPGRDFAFETVDVRTVVAGDTVNGAAIRIEPAIEVGNIFKLGTRYSEPLGARYLDESGQEQLIWMGSYGFGPARAAAAAVEQYADEQGISWPRSMAPFDVELVVLGKRGQRGARARRRGSTRSCPRLGLDTLYDDRDAGPGEKFADAELLGCPARVTIGRRTLAAGRDRGPGPPRARGAHACRWRAPPRRSRSSGGASLSTGARREPDHQAAAVRHRPLGPAAASRRARTSR